MNTLSESVARRLRAARSRIDRLGVEAALTETGSVRHVGDGVARIAGLASARLDELLVFETGARGLAIGLDRETVDAVLLDQDAGIVAGTRVEGTGTVIQVPAGEALLGRVLDSLGRPRDGLPPPEAQARLPIERPAPAIIERQAVTEPLLTGVLAVDAMIPLGRGQRELIIGDRAIGKTSIAVDAILAQQDTDMVCVYAAVGQKLSTVSRVIDTVREKGPFARTIFVVAEADDPPGAQWVAPFAACAMAEWFRDRGRHALLVIDDLTKHAAVHRQISLLLRNPPGREAYPGDVFYLHARLLERAAKLSEEKGGGSLSALPIAETQAGNIAAYIPTNLISITDGQIYLETRLFHEGVKPAVNIGLSVSRVGGKTQSRALAELSESLRLQYAQFLELEAFTRFGHMMDERTTRTIEHGRRIRAILLQPRAAPQSLSAQVAQLLAVKEGLFDDAPLAAVAAFKDGLETALGAQCPRVVRRLEQDGTLPDEERGLLLAFLRERVAPLGAPGTPERDNGEADRD